MGPLFPKIEGLLRHAVKEIINPFYGVQINTSEMPQVLSYGIGGHYKLTLMVKVSGSHQRENISGKNLLIEIYQWCSI